MTDDQATSTHRFAREVSELAPKPGHHLATASFQIKDETFALHVVEGPAADQVGFLGYATNFDRTRLVRFSLQGPLVERLDDLPRGEHQPGMAHRVSPFGDQQLAEAVVIERATTVFSSVRAANRIDPDGAIVAYDLLGGERVAATITGYQRGWYLPLVIIVVGLAIAVLLRERGEGETIEVSVEQDTDGAPVQVAGSVTFRQSLSG